MGLHPYARTQSRGLRTALTRESREIHMIRLEAKIAVIGLGYVGLPLAVAFGATRQVVGFDINEGRIAELRRGEDRTLETTTSELQAATGLSFTADAARLKECGIFIVTVPTPIDKANRPDLTPLITASKLVGQAISPALSSFLNRQFILLQRRRLCPNHRKRIRPEVQCRLFLGYSPERINPRP